MVHRFSGLLLLLYRSMQRQGSEGTDGTYRDAVSDDDGFGVSDGDDDLEDLARTLESPVLKLQDVASVDFATLHRPRLTISKHIITDSDDDTVAGGDRSDRGARFAGPGTGDDDMDITPTDSPLLTLNAIRSGTSGATTSGGGLSAVAVGGASAAFRGQHVIPGSPAVMSLSDFAIGINPPKKNRGVKVEVPNQSPVSAASSAGSPDILRRFSEKFPSKIKGTVTSLFHRATGDGGGK